MMVSHVQSQIETRTALGRWDQLTTTPLGVWLGRGERKNRHFEDPPSQLFGQSACSRYHIFLLHDLPTITTLADVWIFDVHGSTWTIRLSTQKIEKSVCLFLQPQSKLFPFKPNKVYVVFVRCKIFTSEFNKSSSILEVFTHSNGSVILVGQLLTSKWILVAQNVDNVTRTSCAFLVCYNSEQGSSC